MINLPCLLLPVREIWIRYKQTDKKRKSKQIPNVNQDRRSGGSYHQDQVGVTIIDASRTKSSFLNNKLQVSKYENIQIPNFNKDRGSQFMARSSFNLWCVKDVVLCPEHVPKQVWSFQIRKHLNQKCQTRIFVYLMMWIMLTYLVSFCES